MLNPLHLLINGEVLSLLRVSVSSLLFPLFSSLSFNTAIVKTYLLVKSLLHTLVNYPLPDMYSVARLLSLAVLLGALLASAHGMIVTAFGDDGDNGIGLGVSSPT